MPRRAPSTDRPISESTSWSRWQSPTASTPSSSGATATTNSTRSPGRSPLLPESNSLSPTVGPGDPNISEPTDGYGTEPDDGLPDEVDVLIVGSGPAGLNLAAQLAAFPGIRTRVVEHKPGRLLRGQDDGIACRTMEVFEALGFSERVLKEAYWVNETRLADPETYT